MKIILSSDLIGCNLSVEKFQEWPQAADFTAHCAEERCQGRSA